MSGTRTEKVVSLRSATVSSTTVPCRLVVELYFCTVALIIDEGHDTNLFDNDLSHFLCARVYAIDKGLVTQV